MAGADLWPVPLTSLIGRERDIEVVAGLLRSPDARLVVLTGTGGVGKTRLAAATGEAVRTDFPDGVHFISAAALHDPELLLPTIAHALGLPENARLPAAVRLATHLQDRETLLIVDNLEHMISAGPALARLLAACPLLRMLGTSRVPLRVSPEFRFPVPPLETAGEPASEGGELASALQLFLARARAVDPDFTLSSDNVRAIGEICVRLGGIPLAIELAAARSSLLPPAELLQRLEAHRSLSVLTGGPHDLPERQRTMRATVEWSYALLPPPAQACWRRLGVFAGGSTVDAVEDVAGADSLDAVALLVDSGLLHRRADSGQARLHMLEPLREYAREQLQTAGEEGEMAGRHLRYYAGLMQEAEDALAGAHQHLWLGRLDREFANLRAAVQWALAHGEVAQATPICSLWQFYLLRGHLLEVWNWLERVLEDQGEGNVPARVRLLRAAGYLSLYLGAYARGVGLAAQGVELARELGHTRELAASLTGLGLLTNVGGDRDGAARLLGEAITRYRATDDRAGLAHALLLNGINRSRARYRVDFDESLALYRTLGNRWGESSVLHGLGWVLLEGRAYLQAWDHFAGGFRSAVELGHTVLMVMHLDGLGAAAAGQRRYRDALRLLGAADRLSASVSVARTPQMTDAYTRARQQAERALDDRTVTETVAEGNALSLDEILGLIGMRTPGRAGAARPAGLTRREVEVLRLVAEGLTNAEVAQRLVISVRTVDAHLTAIYGKLRLSSRSAATRAAIELGLVDVSV